MITKPVIKLAIQSIEPLNKPDWEEYNLTRIKVAKIDKPNDLNGFDLETAKKEHPDHLFVKIFAIKENEVNDNGDAFSKKELKKAYKTFVGVPVFTNHQNDDVEKARGKCVHSWYDDDAGGIFIISMIDKVAYPRLARGIQEQYITGSSMGCFTGDMRVLLSSGIYKPIKDIKPNDYVITHKGSIKPVINVQKHFDKINDFIYYIEVEGIPNVIMATKEHPFYVLKTQNRCFITGDKIPADKGYNRFKRRTKFGVYQKEEYAVAIKNKELEKYDFEWKKTEDLTTRDMVVFPISNFTRDNEDATIEKAKLIGYFLAEGRYIKYKGERIAVEFNFSLAEKNTLVKEVDQLLKFAFPGFRNKPKIQERPKKNVCMIRLYDKEIAAWFYKYCEEYAHKKRLFGTALYWPKEIQKYIVSAWINGDGCRCRIKCKKNDKIYDNLTSTTCSEILANQMKFLLSRFGIYSTITVCQAKKIKKATKHFYNISIGSAESQKLNQYICSAKRCHGDYKKSWFRKAGNYIVMPIKKISKRYNSKPVYNLQVQDDNSYIVEGVAVKNCAVDYSCCSICHRKSAVADEYCDHIKNQKTRKINAVIPCKYHESPSKPTDNCPICGQTYEDYKNGNINKFKHSESQVYEWNYGVKFIEDSFVVNPACHDCLVQEILNSDVINKKVANIKEKLEKLKKVASCTGGCSLEKFAGEKELNYLDEAMNKIIVVSKSLMAQNKQVSMEYVSNLVDVLANLQATTDELTEMGYGELPSPDSTQVENMEVPTEEELKKETEQQEQPILQQPQPVAQQIPPAGQTPVIQSSPGVMTEQFGDLGSVTKPKLSEATNKKKKELLQPSGIIVDKLDEVQEKYTKMEKEQNPNINKESKTMSDTKQGNSEPTIEKVANPEHRIDVINEKQLDDAEFTGERQDEKYPKVITEKQMENPDRDVNVTSSESPQPRKDDSPNVITEKQFNNIKGAHVVRWNDFPNVITEKQWTETSRRLGSELSKDQSNIITEKQLTDFLDHHRYIDINVITEKQLGDDKFTSTGDLSRWAYVYDAGRLVKSAAEAMSDAIAYYGYTPDEIKEAAAFITENPKNRNKAAYLTLINALPHKKTARENEKARYEYFSKIANKEVKPEVIDALILSMADAVSDMSADDLVDTVSHVAFSDKAFAKIDKMALDKMNSVRERKEGGNKIASLKNAITNLGVDKEDDGLYEVRTHIDDLNIENNSENAVSVAAYNFANEKVAESVGESIDTALMNVKVNKETGQVIALVKEASKLTTEESTAWEQAKIAMDSPDEKKQKVQEEKEAEIQEETKTAEREEIVKEAQLLGGEMGGQGGAAQGPGAGAMAPQPPAAAGVPLESFEGTDLEGELEGEGDLVPKPPGSTCPVCTSEDVDMVGGQGRCNNCGAKISYEIILKVLEWPGTLETTKEPAVEEEEVGEEGGFEMPEAPEPGAAPVAPAVSAATPPMPAAASVDNDKVVKTAEVKYAEFENFMRKSGKFASIVRITPEMIEKAKEAKVELGSVSPLTGSTNTIKLENGDHVCLDTGSMYTVDYRVNKNDPTRIYARWIWSPDGIKVGCSKCEHSRLAFVEALKEHETTEEEFDVMGLKEKGELIIKMKDAGSLKTIKTASDTKSVLEMVKEASVNLDPKNFPMEACVQKLANRYGEDAVALSGPCEGKNLADCVCKSLKKAGVYSTGLAMKVADIWKDKESITECLEDFVRLGHDLKTASSICEAMKTKYAQFDDFVADELTDEVGNGFGENFDEDFVEDEVAPFDEMEEVAEDAVATALADLARALGKEDAVADELAGEVEPEVEPKVEPEGEVVVDVSEEVTPIEDREVDEEEIAEEVAETPEEQAIEEETLRETIEECEENEDEEECSGGSVSMMEGGEVTPEVVPEGGEMAPANGGEVESKCPPCPPCPPCPEEKNDNPGVLNEDEDDEKVEKEGYDNEKESEQMDYTEKEAAIMRRSYIGRTNEINHLDFSKLEGLLNKQADIIKSKPAQEVAPGPIKDNTSIGNEDSFSAEKPSAPSKGDAAAIKNEEPPKAEPATAPVFDARMGGEKDDPEKKPEFDDVATGGDQGQGTSRAASTRERISRLADNIIAQTKVKRKQNQDDEDTKPYSGNSYIGGEKESVGEIPASQPGAEQGIPRSEAFIGNEKESIGEKPDVKDMPSIPTKDDRISGEKDNEVLKPEKDDEATGNVKEMVASAEINKEAVRVAGKMLQEGKINIEELSTKIAELQRYKIEQLKDFEKNIFESKGLDNKSSGLEQAPVISESANMPKVTSTKEELIEAIQSMFKLDRQNKKAQQDNDIQIRKEYGLL